MCLCRCFVFVHVMVRSFPVFRLPASLVSLEYWPELIFDVTDQRKDASLNTVC